MSFRKNFRRGNLEGIPEDAEQVSGLWSEVRAGGRILFGRDVYQLRTGPDHNISADRSSVGMERALVSGHRLGDRVVSSADTISDTLCSNFVDLPRSGNRSGTLSSGLFSKGSIHVRKIFAQLVGRAEESVFSSFLAGVQHLADGAQFERFVVS